MTPDDITEPNITGGYLLEIDSRAPESGDKYLITNKGLRLGIKYPDSDDITIEQENYIKKYLNDLEERIYNYNLSYIDENSFYKYFLMQEFCADIDIVFSSFYIYKRRNDIKLHFGPVWDYDRAFDDDMRLIPTNLKPKFAFYYGGTSGNDREIFTIILKTTNVIDNISQTWIDLQNNGLNKETLINFIEDKKNLLMESANLNFLRWYKGKIGKGIEEYSNAVDIIVNYINLRFESLTRLIEKARNGDKINGYGALIFIFIFIFIIILIFILI